MSRPRTHKLTIVGASTRAAAVSAVRGGITPDCFDLFADVDLRQICEATRWPDYPHRLAELLNESAGDYWMYTGALENYPDEIVAGCERKQLLGNNANVIQRLRDPFWLRDFLLQRETLGGGGAGAIQFPNSRRYDSPPVRFTGWIDKPIASGAGMDIRLASALLTENSRSNIDDSSNRYWQQLVVGDSVSGCFLAERGKATLLGATKQLTGESWLSAPAFAYCGSSLSPDDFTTGELAAMQSLGDDLVRETGLTGLFGVDFIRSANGKLFLLEVNPRYTASCELIEMAINESLVKLHVESCLRENFRNETDSTTTQRVIEWNTPSANANGEFRKAVLYADQSLVISEEFFDWATAAGDNDFSYALADIPAAGEPIPQGGPICTMLTSADDRTVADAQIRQLAVAVRTRLSGAESFGQ